MLCKIDENLPVEAAAQLRDAGHETHTVYDERLAGAPDQSIGEHCRNERRVLFTLDLDFADIRRYPPGQYAGIVVLRPTEPDKERTLRLLGRLIPLLTTEPLEGRLWIVEDSRVRVRGPGSLSVYPHPI